MYSYFGPQYLVYLFIKWNKWPYYLIGNLFSIPSNQGLSSKSKQFMCYELFFFALWSYFSHWRYNKEPHALDWVLKWSTKSEHLFWWDHIQVLTFKIVCAMNKFHICESYENVIIKGLKLPCNLTFTLQPILKEITIIGWCRKKKFIVA